MKPSQGISSKDLSTLIDAYAELAKNVGVMCGTMSAIIRQIEDLRQELRGGARPQPLKPTPVETTPWPKAVRFDKR